MAGQFFSGGTIRIEITGLTELTRGMKRGKQVLDREMNVMVKDVSYLLENYVKSGPITRGGYVKGKAPKASTFMAQHITTRLHTDSAEVTTTSTPYATYVHGGTGKMKARPFFYDAPIMTSRQILQAANNAAKRITERISK